jgi:hypothetical protein
MKTPVSDLIAGALSTTVAFAGVAPASRNVAGDNAIATLKLPFRLSHKRPAGARRSAVAEPTVNVRTPQMPFGLIRSARRGRRRTRRAALKRPIGSEPLFGRPGIQRRRPRGPSCSSGWTRRANRASDATAPARDTRFQARFEHDRRRLGTPIGCQPS